MTESFDRLRALMIKDRSVRRFDESRPVSEMELENILSLTRYCASGRNLQPLRYRAVTERHELEAVYPLLKWAGYLTEWDGPEIGERPTAMAVQLLDTRLTEDCMCDDGLHLQTITLGAASMEIGGCIIKSFNGPKLKEVLGIPSYLKPLHVVALGYPAEQVVIEPVTDGDIKYWRDAEGVHHVPKREFELI